MRKFYKIFLNCIPVLVMVAMIPLIMNDYLLALAYLIVILISFFIKIEKNEIKILILGFLLMIFFNKRCISTTHL